MYKYLVGLFFILGSTLFGEGVDHEKHWDGKNYFAHSEEQRKAALAILSILDLHVGEHVLDIGCGDGYITSLISEKVPLGAVLGTDISPSMIHFASHNFIRHNLKFQVLDAREIDYENQFDRAVSFTVLQWIREQPEMLARVYRALKPQGRIFFEFPCALPESMGWAIREVMAMPEWSSYFIDYIPNIYFFGYEEYLKYLQDANFKVIKAETLVNETAFPNRGAFTAFLKQWFPYQSVIPNELKDAFFDDVVNRYKKYMPLKGGKFYQWNPLRMRVEAEKV